MSYAKKPVGGIMGPDQKGASCGARPFGAEQGGGSMQHEITHAIPLLDERGNLTEPGWARRLLPVYDRARVKGGPTGCREWDDYLVMGPGFALALTIADHFYLGLDSISLLDFREGWQMTRCPRRPFPMGRTGLPETSERGNAAVSGRGYGILFHNDGLNRTLTAHMDAFREGAALDAHIVLRDEPEESMVLSVPFDRPGHFYFSQKIHGMRADGTVQLGTRRYDFHLGDSFGILDWGRGVWTCRDTWYRASAAGLLGGAPFGFHLGRGLGDACTATENILFYQGRGHKLSRVDFRIPRRGGRDDFRSPWVLASDDGRFEAVFRPMPARAGAEVVRPDHHQVFGVFTGAAVLDGGERLEFRDLMGLAEKVENKW